MKLQGQPIVSESINDYICKMSVYKVIEVLNKRDLRRFIKFPDILYKDCPQYVPALHSDQVRSLTKAAPLD